MNFQSKLPDVSTTIFTVMSALAARHGAINLSQGYPNFEVDQHLKDLVNKYVQQGQNQYAPMTGVPVLRQAISRKKKLLYHVSVDPDDEITITNGATEAIYSAISAFISPGDEVIIFEPAYDSYIPSILVNGGRPISIRLKSPEFKINWNEVKDKITSRTKMIMINTPHNPTGSVLSDEDLLSLEKIVEDSDILILSDEVYQHLIYDGLEHQSILLYPELFRRSMVIMSFGKTFHATGWRIGYVVAPRSITSEIRKVHQYNTFSINRPLQHALAEYLEKPAHYLDLPKFYQQKRDLFSDAISSSKFELIPSLGTYFILAYYRKISDLSDQEFARWMTIEKGVAVIPISSFYSDDTDEHIIRFCFAKTDELLAEAAELINQVE